MNKNVWRVIGLSGIVLIIFVMIGANYIKNTLMQSDEILESIEQQNAISDELKMDAKQVFGVIEQARQEQRELTVEEQMLVNEFDAKYEAKQESLTTSESLLVYNLLLMSHETIPSSKLKSEANRYEEYREEVLKYLNR